MRNACSRRIGTSSNSSDRAVRDLEEHTVRRYGEIRYGAIKYDTVRDGEVGRKDKNETN